MEHGSGATSSPDLSRCTDAAWAHLQGDQISAETGPGRARYGTRWGSTQAARHFGETRTRQVFQMSTHNPFEGPRIRGWMLSEAHIVDSQPSGSANAAARSVHLLGVVHRRQPSVSATTQSCKLRQHSFRQPSGHCLLSALVLHGAVRGARLMSSFSVVLLCRWLLYASMQSDVQ